MKKLSATLLLILLAAAFLLPAPARATRTYGANAIYGGAAGAMDAINGANLSDGDRCWVSVLAEGRSYLYIYNSTIGGVEAVPYVIAPDVNGGNGRWLLVKIQFDSLKLKTGAEVNDISDDETLAGASPTALITERAAKKYSDELYRALFIPASAFTPQTTAGPATGSVETTTNKGMFDYLAFDGTVEEYAFANVVLAGYDSRVGGAIKFKFLWRPFNDNGSTSDGVEWEVAGAAISDNGAVDVAPGTSQVVADTLLAGENTVLHYTDATPAVTFAGTYTSATNEALVHLQVSRNVGGTADTYTAGDALLFGVLVQYPFNGKANFTAW
jgi:hypothetical protein